MVSRKPEFGKVIVGDVLRNVLGIDMTVIVDDRTILRKVVVKTLGSGGRKQELISDQCGHEMPPCYMSMPEKNTGEGNCLFS